MTKNDLIRKFCGINIKNKDYYFKQWFFVKNDMPISKIAVDVDGFLCFPSEPDKFDVASPIIDNIDIVNSMYNRGIEIVIYTARLEQDREVTKTWLDNNNVKYNSLVMEKPKVDYYIDDRGINPYDY